MKVVSVLARYRIDVWTELMWTVTCRCWIDLGSAEKMLLGLPPGCMAKPEAFDDAVHVHSRTYRTL
jgi:hypothetical protein